MLRIYFEVLYISVYRYEFSITVSSYSILVVVFSRWGTSQSKSRHVLCTELLVFSVGLSCVVFRLSPSRFRDASTAPSSNCGAKFSYRERFFCFIYFFCLQDSGSNRLCASAPPGPGTEKGTLVRVVKHHETFLVKAAAVGGL